MANTSGSARDAATEAKQGARDATKAVSEGSGDLQADFAALRDDVARLGAQLADILSTRGDAVWTKAKSNVEGVVSGVQEKGMDAVDAVRDVGDNVVEAIDISLKERPYTTLAIAVGIGFLFGATWRR